MIEDSDIFAIDIDPRNADHVIASACSGIYETRDAERIGGRHSFAIAPYAGDYAASVGRRGGICRDHRKGLAAHSAANNSWMVTTCGSLKLIRLPCICTTPTWCSLNE
jgi:hypothetical protein